MKKSKVFILYTGGTIGMAPKNPKNPESPLEPKPLDELKAYIPSLDDSIELGYATFKDPMDSSNLDPSHWVQMADMIANVYNEYDGFIILHGTDTMAYTSSALAFMFENLSKPILVTGSQLPISHPRTDAVMNLVNSLHIAAYKTNRLPCIPEVAIVFADKILRGCRARKVSSKAWAGFDSPNFPPLGMIGEHIEINSRLLRPKPSEGQTLRINRELSQNVLDISLFPGLSPATFDTILNKTKGIEGIILRTYGAGNAPDTDEFLSIIEKASAEKKLIVNVTQCVEGMVEMGLYTASSGLLERGVISGLDMTPEASLTKLMWTKATKINDQIALQMQVNQRGEQSENLFDLRYGSCGSVDDKRDKFDDYKTPDRRFVVKKFSRAVVRFSNLTVSSEIESNEGSRKIYVYMNYPGATSETGDNHDRCIASIPIFEDDKPFNIAYRVDDTVAKSTFGEGEITLSVRSDTGVDFSFDGLFLALFASA